MFAKEEKKIDVSFVEAPLQRKTRRKTNRSKTGKSLPSGRVAYTDWR